MYSAYRWFLLPCIPLQFFYRNYYEIVITTVLRADYFTATKLWLFIDKKHLQASIIC